MPLEKIIQIEGTGVYVPGNDIDTDRIIPAQFMKCVTFDGLGQYLFYDVRFDKAGKSLNHPLDAPQYKGASILFSGRNFGCGSSREHAPQSLQKFGIRAIIAESFAEIFAGNCTTLGMPCARVTGPEIALLVAAIEKNPNLKIRIDLATSTITCDKRQISFQMKVGAREALLKGEWDALGQLLDGKAQVAALAGKLGYNG
ncbi:MAG: 3-isopropylmalate dehydratase small subunit [Planctomycetota bacterium]